MAIVCMCVCARMYVCLHVYMHDLCVCVCVMQVVRSNLLDYLLHKNGHLSAYE